MCEDLKSRFLSRDRRSQADDRFSVTAPRLRSMPKKYKLIIVSYLYIPSRVFALVLVGRVSTCQPFPGLLRLYYGQVDTRYGGRTVAILSSKSSAGMSMELEGLQPHSSGRSPMLI